MNTEELYQVLSRHKEWLKGKGGERADLRGANLREADLWKADLREADLRGADLWVANLREADLQEADLQEANLREADLREADLRGARLVGADIRWCIGNGKEVRSLQVGQYAITYTKDVMAIGCMQHTLEEWRTITKDKIKPRSSRELFERHMPWVLETISRFPAD